FCPFLGSAGCGLMFFSLILVIPPVTIKMFIPFFFLPRMGRNFLGRLFARPDSRAFFFSSAVLYINGPAETSLSEKARGSFSAKTWNPFIKQNRKISCQLL